LLYEKTKSEMRNPSDKAQQFDFVMKDECNVMSTIKNES